MFVETRGVIAHFGTKSKSTLPEVASQGGLPASMPWKSPGGMLSSRATGWHNDATSSKANCLLAKEALDASMGSDRSSHKRRLATLHAQLKALGYQ